MKITAWNPPTDELEKSYLSSDVDAGATSVTVKNNDRFSQNDVILVGRMGQERSELSSVSAAVTAGTALSVDALTFPHNADDPVYVMSWNKVRFYRSTDGIDGTYSVLTTVDIDVDNENKNTVYDDTAALNSYYYKVSYYNSVTTTESSLSDPISAIGFDNNTIGDVIDRATSRVGDPGFTTLSQKDYIGLANEVNDDLITQTRRPYRFLKTSQTLSTTASQNYVSLDTVTDLWKINFITYAYTVGGSTRTYRFEQDDILSYEDWINKFDNGNWTDSDAIVDIAINEEDNRIMIGPPPATSQSDVVTLHYWKKFTKFTGVGGIVETPNTSIYYNKFLAEYYAAKAEIDPQFLRLSEKYEQKYGNEVVKMQRVNRLDAGTSQQWKGPGGYRRRYHL